MKKGEWYYTKSCKHVKNHVEFASHSCQTIAQQVVNGIYSRTSQIL
jgi:ADP-dependent phosphofructokinase/glucokinase